MLLSCTPMVLQGHGLNSPRPRFVFDTQRLVEDRDRLKVMLGIYEAEDMASIEDHQKAEPLSKRPDLKLITPQANSQNILLLIENQRLRKERVCTEPWQLCLRNRDARLFRTA